MSSDRSSNTTRAPRARVLKSHQVSQSSFTFPSLEQVAPGDLPPSVMATPPVREEMQRTLEETRDALQLLEQARAVEARAKAVERRALAILQEAEETAAARLREAEVQAHELITRAGEAASAFQAEARADGQATGHEDGYRAGLQNGQTQAEALVAEAGSEAEAIVAEARREADTIRQEALEERSLLLDASSQQLLDLAFAMARQVLKAELALRPTALVPMLEAALAKLKGEEEPQIRVSPEALVVLEEHRGRLMAAIAGARKAEAEGDPALGPGDFLVQGNQGFVDGRLERQVDVLAEKVRTEEQ